MKRKIPAHPPANKPASPSVAGEEDPGASLDAGDEAALGTPGSREAVCNRCGGSGKFNDVPCPTCGGIGKVMRGIGSG